MRLLIDIDKGPIAIFNQLQAAEDLEEKCKVSIEAENHMACPWSRMAQEIDEEETE